MTTKPRYRILWDGYRPEHPDFWLVGTDIFMFMGDNRCHRHIFQFIKNNLKTRIL